MSLDPVLPHRPLSSNPTEPSTARLEAEAAFAPPRRVGTPAPTAQVTVRRRRVARPAVEPVTGDAPDMAENGGADTRSPRVFRLEGPAEPAPAARPAVAPAEPPRPARRRRLAPERRPSPVVHHVPEVEDVPAGALDPRLNRLAEHLAPVGRLLDEIARAQAFRFDGAECAGDWQALARRVEALRGRTAGTTTG